MTAFQTPSNGLSDCIQNCTACEHLSLEALAWCQAKGSDFARPGALALLALCADVCNTTARAMLGGSDAYVFLCEACAGVCERCANHLASLGDEPALRACIAACANCARSCTEMTSEARLRARKAS